MVFDIVFLIFIGAGFYRGFRTGIIYSLFSLVGFFLGIIAALRFSYMVVNMLNGFLSISPKTLAIIAFVLVFILVLLLLKLLAWGLEQILKSFALNLPNQIIGGVIHSLIGLYVFCVITWFVNKLDVIPLSQKKESHTFVYISNLAPRVVEVSGKVVPLFKDTFSKFDVLFGTSSTN